MVSTLRNWRLALTSAFVLAAAPSWAQESPEPPTTADAAVPAQPGALSSIMNAELFYELLVGEMSAAQGDATNAVALMMEAARKIQSETLYQRAAEVALQSRSGQRALMVGNEWSQSFPQSREANRYMLQVLLMLNRISETQPYLSREVAWVPDSAKSATYLAIAQLYGRATDKALAAAVVEQALQEDIPKPALAASAWATIGHMRLQAGQKDLAMQALLHAHAQDPRSGATALLALELLESGQLAAQALVQDYMQHDPAPTIQMAYVRVLMGQSRWQEAQTQLTPVLKAQPDMAEAWLSQATLHTQQNQWNKAKQAWERAHSLLLQIPNEMQRSNALSQAYLQGARLALSQKDYAQAIVWIDQIPAADQNLSLQSLKAQALAKQGKLAQGRALIRAVPARNDVQNQQKRQAEVALLRDNNAPQEAYLLQRTLYDKQPDNVDIAYETALLAERAGKLETMEQILRGILDKHPHHYHAANALGYSYADRGIHLEEAKRLIESALAQAPGDPFITDSLAWVEFRLGHKDKALALLEQAYAARDDVEIAAHLGEVLWSTGNKARARSIWRQALDQDADNATLRSTLKRLQVDL